MKTIADGRCAEESLVNLIYEELLLLADAKLQKARLQKTLDPADVAHAALGRLRWLDMAGKPRAYLFGAAAKAMQRLLDEHCRVNARRNNRLPRVEADDGVFQDLRTQFRTALIDLKPALNKLQKEHPHQHAVLMLTNSGFTKAGIARAFSTNVRLVNHDLDFATTFISLEINGKKTRQ
jgi:hypothetical protein